MGDLEADLTALEDGLIGLESTIGATQAVSATFQGELLAMRQTMSATGREVDGLSRSIGWGLRRAFDGLVFDGMRLSDALKTVGRSMVNAAFSQAIRPVQNALGGLLATGVQSLVGGLLSFQNGAAFSQGRVTPFARGGVVSGPTTFPMRGGLGLMGEAGPEAIMPLARGSDGRLGVRAERSRPVQVTMHISTPDAEGFRRSRTQIAAELNRAISRGARNG